MVSLAPPSPQYNVGRFKVNVDVSKEAAGKNVTVYVP
jgi:hypothetical protein